MVSRRWLFVGLGIVGLVAIAWTVTGVDLAQIDPAAIAAQIRGAGPLGLITLLSLLMVQCVVAPLPSEPLMMAAGFVYGAAGGFLIAWTGVVCGAVMCFFLARSFGRPFVERFVSVRSLAILDAFGEGSARVATFVAVLSLRLFAFMAFDVLSYACGLISFPFRWFLLATAIGAVPKVFVFTYFGANVAARPGWLDWAITAGTFGVLLTVPLLIRAWQRARVAPHGT
jgi:uncharacterized membrane protein YdjX (TVP38/TMEM64 family)